MAGPVTQPALVTLLDDLQSERDTWVMGLYTNNYTPLETSVIGDFTEATFGGYSRVAVDAWGAAFWSSGGWAESDAALATFTATGAGLPVTVYGYFLLDAGGNVVGAERNPAGGVTLSTAGQVFPVWPRFTLANA